MIWLMMAILRPRLHLNSLQSEFYLDYIQKKFSHRALVFLWFRMPKIKFLNRTVCSNSVQYIHPVIIICCMRMFRKCTWIANKICILGVWDSVVFKPDKSEPKMVESRAK